MYSGKSLNNKVFFAWGFKKFKIQQGILTVWYDDEWYPVQMLDVA